MTRTWARDFLRVEGYRSSTRCRSEGVEAMMKTAENVTMRDIAVLREWASSGQRRTSYAALAKRAEKNGDSSWAALGRIAELINAKKGPWSEVSK